MTWAVFSYIRGECQIPNPTEDLFSGKPADSLQGSRPILAGAAVGIATGGVGGGEGGRNVVPPEWTV